MTGKNLSTSAARGPSRVALVTCAEFSALEADDQLVLAPLAQRGIDAVPAVWDDPSVDWASYDLVVLRSPWDYVARRELFVDWARRIPRLVNPADVVAWNTDKSYLADLAAAGVATVPTSLVEPGWHWQPRGDHEVVIKPAVSVGSVDTGRYRLADPEHRQLAIDHVARLQAAGRMVMVQPYLTAVDEYGETALQYIGGRFSHAVRKGPMLTGPDRGGTGLYRPEVITPRRPTTAELALAHDALNAVPGGPERLLYARVDVIPAADGTPVLVELELTEPSLFFGFDDAAADRYADAVAGMFTGALNARH